MRMRKGSDKALIVAAMLVVPSIAAAKDLTYKGKVDVRPASGVGEFVCDRMHDLGKPCVLTGLVFEDLDRDGKHERGEPGIAGVAVSNGVDVVHTDAQGRYSLPVREQPGGTTIFMTKPAAYDVPVDAQNMPQFFYHHLPEGSPKLRFGGLPPTGPLPKAVNFPLIRGAADNVFKIVVSGDTQPYSNTELGYVRDTLAEELAAMNEDEIEFTIVEGDVMGDDLGLFPRFKKIMSISGAPLYLVPGNHDIDFDAKDDAHSFDTFRREFGPAYYSFEVGKVHFVVLDDMRYPCTPELDNADGRHDFCNDPVNTPRYNGVISEQQMTWLANDLKRVPADRLVVLNQHIPIVTFTDQSSTQHQVDNAAALYDLLKGRQVLTFAGHTHTLEQLRPGEVFEGWNGAMAVPAGPTPFHQIVAGAACGGWWSGDFDDDGIPMAYQKLGAPRGYLVVEFTGTTYQERFKATGKAKEEQMSLSFLSPTFQSWYDKLVVWLETPEATRSELPPVSINDLPDPSILTAADQAGGTFLVANVWNGSQDSRVYAQIDGGAELELTRTQPGKGEGELLSLDPYALEKQLYVLRYAIRSESGDPRAQGFEQFRGSQRIGPPQPMGRGDLTDQSNHLWTVPVPKDLAEGAHKAKVTTIDAYGNQYSSVIAFEVLAERPFPWFRKELFE
jgi:3',5'-cyclic AMP phosphodiesterase CpdA